MPTSKTLDLRRQVGQLLIMGFEGLEMDSKLRTTLATLEPGGVILFARNIESARQTWDLLRDCQAAVRLPMFLAVDMEGGKVDRFKDVLGPAPSAEKVFASGVRQLSRMHGNVIGLEVRALGFNTDFAPVLDIGLAASRSVLASRTVSQDPEKVVVYGREFLLGLKAAKVLGCGKHFPGLGGGDLDSHHKRPEIKRSWKKLWQEDLVPYRQLHRQLPFIMVAHAHYPQVTKDSLPASLSRKWIHEVLRKKIGYRGLIVSDDLEMGGALAAGSMEEIAVETIRAGSDIFLICRDQELVWRGYEAVLHQAEKERKFAARVAESAARILQFKRRSRELRWVSAKPTAQVLKKLKKVARDYAKVIEEYGV